MTDELVVLRDVPEAAVHRRRPRRAADDRPLRRAAAAARLDAVPRERGPLAALPPRRRAAVDRRRVGDRRRRGEQRHALDVHRPVGRRSRRRPGRSSAPAAGSAAASNEFPTWSPWPSGTSGFARSPASRRPSSTRSSSLANSSERPMTHASAAGSTAISATPPVCSAGTTRPSASSSEAGSWRTTSATRGAGPLRRSGWLRRTAALRPARASREPAVLGARDRRVARLRAPTPRQDPARRRQAGRGDRGTRGGARAPPRRRRRCARRLDRAGARARPRAPAQ